MFKFIQVSAITLFLSGIPVGLSADPITYNFTGTVISQTGVYIGQGTEVTGSITFDTSLIDGLASNGVTDNFFSGNAANSLFVWTMTTTNGSVTTSHSVTGQVSGSIFGQMLIEDSSTQDGFNFTVNDSSGQGRSNLSLGDINNLNLVLPGTGGLADSAGFDLTTLLLASVTNQDSFVCTFNCTDPGIPGSGILDFSVTNISAVPIPGALLLFGSGLLGLFGIGKHSKRQLT